MAIAASRGRIQIDQRTAGKFEVNSEDRGHMDGRNKQGGQRDAGKGTQLVKLVVLIGKLFGMLEARVLIEGVLPPEFHVTRWTLEITEESDTA